MPRKPLKVIKHNEDLRLTSDRIENLVIGRSLIETFPFNTEEHRKNVWRFNREKLMSQRQFACFGQPTLVENTRPCAHYQYDKGLVLGVDFEMVRKATPDNKGWKFQFVSLKHSG